MTNLNRKSKRSRQFNENSPFSFLWIWPTRALISSLRVWSSFFIPTENCNIFSTLQSFSVCVSRDCAVRLNIHILVNQTSSAKSLQSSPTFSQVLLLVYKSALLSNRTYCPLEAPHPAQSSACSQGQTPSVWEHSAPRVFLAPKRKIDILVNQHNCTITCPHAVQ